MLLAGGAEQVLHTDDLGNFKRPKQQQMVERDVAHSDAGDQSVIAGLYHGAQLVVKQEIPKMTNAKESSPPNYRP
jgi:hypothetical protein